MNLKLDDAGMRAALISQVLDIFPKFEVDVIDDKVILRDDTTLLISFVGDEQARSAMVSGFLAGIVKGFHIAVDPMTDPDDLASGKRNDN